MGDLNQTLQQYLGQDFMNAMESVGSIIPVIGGAIKAVSMGKSALQMLGVLDQPVNPFSILLDEIRVIQQKLDQILAQIEKDRLEQATGITLITRAMLLNDASNIQTGAYDAYACAKFPSEDNAQTLVEIRDSAQASVNHFVDNPNYWKRIFLEATVYSDVWSGPLAPPLEADGVLVWDYSVVLLSYIDALANWLVIILLSDSGFGQAHLFNGTEIIKHINQLYDALLKILTSYEPIRHPDYYELQYLIFATNDANFYQILINGSIDYLSSEEHDQILPFIPGGNWRLAGYPCGMVERYMGRFNLMTYPLTEIAEGSNYLDFSGSYWVGGANPAEVVDPAGGHVEVTDADGYERFYNRFCFHHTLRTWQQARILSRDLGLRRVWSLIQELCAARRIPTPNLPDTWFKYVDTPSIRQLCGFLPNLIEGLNPWDTISLRQLANSLGFTGTVSLRAMFFFNE
ncbi:MAG TPA: hypothetical protein VEC37_18725 [Bacillota bacterium]|nr:hypothetical protein [Bacillota bacterium]